MALQNLPLQRRLTKAFIDQNPTTIVLVPRLRVKKPAGGWAWEEQAPRPPQVLTLIEQTGLSGQPTPSITVDGVERRVDFQIVAEWDAAIAVDDVFAHQGRDWHVVALWYDNEYEKRALVVARG